MSTSTTSVLFMSERLVRDLGRTLQERSEVRGTMSFPRLNFTCGGSISGWTAVGKRSKKPMLPKLLACSGSLCTRKSSSTAEGSPVCGSSDNCVYRFTLNPQLRFETNEFLGIQQPGMSKLRVFYSLDANTMRAKRMPMPPPPKNAVAVSTGSVPFVHLGE